MAERGKRYGLPQVIKEMQTHGSVDCPRYAHLPLQVRQVLQNRGEQAQSVADIMAAIDEEVGARGPHGLVHQTGYGFGRPVFETVPEDSLLERLNPDTPLPNHFDSVTNRYARYINDTFWNQLNRGTYYWHGQLTGGRHTHEDVTSTLVATGYHIYRDRYKVNPTLRQLRNISMNSTPIIHFLSMNGGQQMLELIHSLRHGRTSGPWDPSLVVLNDDATQLFITEDWPLLPNYCISGPASSDARTIGEIEITLPVTGCPAQYQNILTRLWFWYIEIALPDKPVEDDPPLDNPQHPFMQWVANLFSGKGHAHS
jgi:hypothetical protein